MYPFDDDFTGSMFEDRQSLQWKLNDPRIPQYEKDRLVAAHNNHYIDTMTTDTVENHFRHNVSLPYTETGSSRPATKEYTPLYKPEPSPVYSPSRTADKSKVSTDVYTALKKAAESITVRNTDKKPGRGNTTGAWIINRLNYMFSCLMKNGENGESCVKQTEKLVGSAAGLRDVFAVLKKACTRGEIYFCLPGAMLLVLERYKSSEETENYKNLDKLYKAYMDAVASNISYYKLLYSEINLYAKKGTEYFSITYHGQRNDFSAKRNAMDHAEAYELYRQVIRTYYSDEKPEPVEEKKEMAYEFIRCWCDPLSFYGSENPACGYRSGPQTVGDRYAYFAGKLLDARAQYELIVSCLDKGCEADADFYNKNTQLVKRYIGLCNQSDAFEKIWSRLKGIFRGNADVEKIYISFCGERIRENLDKFNKNTVEYKKLGLLDGERNSELKKVSEKIDEIFSNTEKGLTAASDEGVRAELEKQKKITYERLEEIRRATDKLVTEFYAKKYWIPQKRCRYCGGEFKGVFKKTCISCGKEKDY